MTTRPDRPRYVSLATASAMLDISERTLRRRIAEGKLPYRKTGKGLNAPVRVAEADVLALLLDPEAR